MMNTQQDPKGQKEINEAQKKTNEGQRDINGALCYVDWHSIKATKALTKALLNANVLTEKQLEEVKKELKRAYYTSEKVASIDPPGCGGNFPKEEDEEDPAVVRAA
jgi:hypothetical protein